MNVSKHEDNGNHTSEECSSKDYYIGCSLPAFHFYERHETVRGSERFVVGTGLAVVLYIARPLSTGT